MPSNPDRPFDYDTLKLPAVFVPDSDKGQVSSADINRALGSDALRIPAVFVPEGGSTPGYPYESIGRAEFRPGDDGAAQRKFTSWQSSSKPSDPAQEDSEPAPTLPRTRYRFGAALGGDRSPGQPPNPTVSSGRPAPAAAGLAAGVAAWRSMANPGDVWRQSVAAPTGSTVASSPSGRADAVGDTAVPVAGGTTPAPPSGGGPARRVADARVQTVPAAHPIRGEPG
jgi:hypothetical protein